MKKQRKRSCKVCGAVLRAENLWLCDDCQSTGAGRIFRQRKKINGEELLRIAMQREEDGIDPLAGMSMEEINELAREYGGAYNSYGKLREYVRQTGQLPSGMGGKNRCPKLLRQERPVETLRRETEGEREETGVGKNQYRRGWKTKCVKNCTTCENRVLEICTEVEEGQFCNQYRNNGRKTPTCGQCRWWGRIDGMHSGLCAKRECSHTGKPARRGEMNEACNCYAARKEENGA